MVVEEIDDAVDEFWWKFALGAFSLQGHGGHDRRLGGASSSKLDLPPFPGSRPFRRNRVKNTWISISKTMYSLACWDREVGAIWGLETAQTMCIGFSRGLFARLPTQVILIELDYLRTR